MKVKFYDVGSINEIELKFAVVASTYKDKWIFVKHKKRATWEIPAGHRELHETISKTAARELFEETGALDFIIKPAYDYSVEDSNKIAFGRLFYSCVKELGPLPDYEIGEVKLFEDLPDCLTHPEVQPILYQKVLEWLSK